MWTIFLVACSGSSSTVEPDLGTLLGDDDDASGDEVTGGTDACIGTIPASVVLAHDGDFVSDAGVTVWVCDGSVEIGSANSVVYVEPGVVLDHDGANSTIWARAGSTVEASGVDTVIHAENGTIAASTAVGGEVHACAEVTFDASAVADGC